MKNIIIFFFSLILLTSCSGDSDGTDEIISQNEAPSSPSLSLPENDLYCSTNDLNFKWSSSTDPEGDEVSYLFELAEDSDFTEMYFETEISNLTINIEVPKGKNFYWRVRAKDDKNNYSTYSSTRSFYTEAEQTSNSLPSVPQLVTPDNNSVIAELEVELQWESTDEDEDILRYDLYFGTNSSPVLIEENLEENYYSIINLSPGTTYYWRIKVKDGNSGVTIGQFWSFKTQ
ncbi:fibronectin type III domain-containing protein [Salegentibacter sediminis]|uniref:hypothetical protein n=1 Tax=Salegentibacter sediminis TaxID=1930251 RepID=UPI0009BE47EF|nr:hypothetical protein [Salegentibacter sediminis]